MPYGKFFSDTSALQPLTAEQSRKIDVAVQGSHEKCMNRCRVRPSLSGAPQAEHSYVVTGDLTDRTAVGSRTWKRVQNLGWLLRHWRHVDTFEVGHHADRPHWECYLVAYLTDGRAYVTPFASRTVLAAWLARSRVFRGVQVKWFGDVREVGSDLT